LGEQQTEASHRRILKVPRSIRGAPIFLIVVCINSIRNYICMDLSNFRRALNGEPVDPVALPADDHSSSYVHITNITGSTSIRDVCVTRIRQ
jgi:hypothetical protein